MQWTNQITRREGNSVRCNIRVAGAGATKTCSFADDTAILSRSRCPGRATTQLANHLLVVERWLSDWRIKINEQQCKHITLTLNRETCHPLLLNNTQIPQVNNVTYLGVHLDRRLTWRRLIERKKVHLKLKGSSFHWILNARSPVRLDYTVLLYNSTLKPIWTYGSQLWGIASRTNIDITQRVQSKILRTITGEPWYIRNQNIHRDLSIHTVKVEIDSLCTPIASQEAWLGFLADPVYNATTCQASYNFRAHLAQHQSYDCELD